MSKKVTFVMYHYIRELKNSRYPDIKGLDISLFKEQLKYLAKHYHFIKMEELIYAIDNGTELPPKSVLLTFDDAYSEHFTQVFPILDKMKIQGSFYAPVKAITEHSVLDVNKIHFILASVENKQLLINYLFELLDNSRKEYNLESNDYYYTKLAIANRFDTKEIIFIKRLLQVELIEKLRNILVDNLFSKYVSNDESSFSRELYMNIDQLECMQRNGMHIGAHGYDHYWLGSLSKEKQEIEIQKSLKFIDQIGGDTNNWTMCYPYGNYNNDTINLLKKYNCKLGLTTNVDIARIGTQDRYIIPRLDTNDIPKQANSNRNLWYEKA